MSKKHWRSCFSCNFSVPQSPNPSIASTLLNELGYNRDWIERQLAHGERKCVRAAYNHAEYLPERRKTMQEWAVYLQKLRLETVTNNDAKTARIEHDAALEKVLLGMLLDHTELYKQFSDNESFKNWLDDTIFRLTYKDDKHAAMSA